MMKIVILATVLATLAVVCSAGLTVPSGRRTLVLCDDLGVKRTHSKFFAALASRGHELTFLRASDSNAAIEKYGEFLYDNIVVFAPNTDAFGGSLTAHSIVEFIDAGGNVFLAGAPELTDPTREIAAECGLEFDEDKSLVLDHFSFLDEKDDGDHSLVYSDNFLKKKNGRSVILGAEKTELEEVVFRGVGVAVIDNNPLVVKVLAGSPTSYSYNPENAIQDNPVAMGKNTVLVAALQARNNARVVVAGSLEMFSDEFFGMEVKKNGKVLASKSGNEQFSTELAKWAFQERGVLRSSNVHYSKKGSNEDRPASVRIKDELVYSVEIEEWNGKTWQPFQGEDVQVEFVMLDPYERNTLKHNNKGKFSAEFPAPDVYGVFQFILHYEKTGYTTLDERNQVSVLPFKHNEFERFIVTAYPYYASAFSMLAAFFLFGILFLHYQPATGGKVKGE